MAKGYEALRPDEQQMMKLLRRDPAVRARFLEVLEKSPITRRPPRARRRKSVQADELWQYRMGCYKRSPRRKRLLELLKADPKGHELGWFILFREEIKAAPFFPVDTDGKTWVVAKLDLRYPIQLVLSSVEESLRTFQGDPNILRDFQDRDYGKAALGCLYTNPPVPAWELTIPKRVHVKNLKRRLTVWDRVQEGATFKAVAAKIRSYESTVRDLYEQVALDICGKLPPKGRRPRLLQDFDLDGHRAACPTCNQAHGEKDSCQKWVAYVNQDYVSQRELSVDPFVLERYLDRPTRGGRVLPKPGAD